MGITDEHNVDIGTYCDMKAGGVKQEATAVARQRRGKHVSAAADMQKYGTLCFLFGACQGLQNIYYNLLPIQKRALNANFKLRH
jgi:hypothetical protein